MKKLLLLLFVCSLGISCEDTVDEKIEKKVDEIDKMCPVRFGDIGNITGLSVKGSGTALDVYVHFNVDAEWSDIAQGEAGLTQNREREICSILMTNLQASYIEANEKDDYVADVYLKLYPLFKEVVDSYRNLYLEIKTADGKQAEIEVYPSDVR